VCAPFRRSCVTLESVVPAGAGAAPAPGSVVRVCYNGCVDNAKFTRRAALTGIGGGALLALSGCFLFEDDGSGSSSKKKKSKSKKKK
jgi:hypothetical protein